MPSALRRVDRTRIERLLAVSLGEERAKQVWLDAARDVGLSSSDSYSLDDVVVALDALSSAPGLAGVAARFARVRVDHADASQYAPRDRPSSGSLRAVSPGAAAPAERAAASSGEVVDLLFFLAPALGEEKAREGIAQQARVHGKDPNRLTRNEALAILDAMEHASGLLGVVASFAKVKFLLRYPA